MRAARSSCTYRHARANVFVDQHFDVGLNFLVEIRFHTTRREEIWQETSDLHKEPHTSTSLPSLQSLRDSPGECCYLGPRDIATRCDFVQQRRRSACARTRDEPGDAGRCPPQKAAATTKRQGTVRCALTKKTREETVLGFRGAVAAGEAGSGPQFGADHFGIGGRSERRRRWRRCARLFGKRRAFDQHADLIGIEHFAF